MNKKIFAAVLTGAALMLGGCEKKVDVTMEQIAAANDADTVLNEYESFTVNCSSSTLNWDCKVYIDDEYYYGVDSECQYLFRKSISCSVYSEGESIIYNIIEADPDMVDSLNSSIFGYGWEYQQNIISAEEKDGKLYVETAESPEETAESFEEYDYELQEGDYIKDSYILDADTLIANSVISYICHTDGTETEIETITVSFDSDLPAEVQKLSERLTSTENAMTATLIMYPDTENERVYTMKTPQGEDYYWRIPDDCQIYMDRECTTLYVEGSEDLYSDLTVYSK